MQAKTKLEKRVVELAETMKPVTEKQLAWGYDHCFEKNAVITNKKAYCLECGSTWEHQGRLGRGRLLGQVVPIECPDCGKEITALSSRKRKTKDAAYYGIITTCKEFQVFRILLLKKSSKVGRPTELKFQEVMQHWIHKSGKDFLRTAAIFPMTYDRWLEYSTLQLRSTRSYGSGEKQALYPYKIYPVRKVLPEIKRNGYDGKFYGTNPTIFFHKLLSDPEVETLLKTKQFSLLKYVLKNYPWRHNQLQKYGFWNSIKICMRNQYNIQDASLWIDYVKMLKEFNKDLSNSHFVCPVDLKASHDKLVVKFRERQRKIQVEKLRSTIAESQQAYAETKGKFFGLAFTQGELTVKVLESVEEFMKEGEQLRHCVFASSYYRRPESLILSARIGDKPIETVEISLESLQIVQARGLQNKPSPYHNQVVELVTQHLPVIGKIVRQEARHG